YGEGEAVLAGFLVGDLGEVDGVRRGLRETKPEPLLAAVADDAPARAVRHALDAERASAEGDLDALGGGHKAKRPRSTFDGKGGEVPLGHVLLRRAAPEDDEVGGGLALDGQAGAVPHARPDHDGLAGLDAAGLGGRRLVHDG